MYYNDYSFDENETLSEKELEEINKVKIKILLATCLIIGFIIVIEPKVCFAAVLETKAFLKQMTTETISSEEPFRKLYTTIDYRDKPLRPVVGKVAEIIIDVEVVKETVIKISSLTNAEESIKGLQKIFENKSTIQDVLIGEVVNCIPSRSQVVKPSFLRFQGGMWGETMIGNFLLDKGISAAKGIFNKIGLSKEKIKEGLDNFPFNDEYQQSSRKPVPSQNGISFPSIPGNLKTVGAPAALLILGLVALQLVNRKNNSKPQSKEDDEGLIGSAKVLVTVLTGVQFPKKRVKTFWEKVYDDIQESLYKMVSPNQPYIWILLISFIIWWNSKKLGTWFSETDTKYLGGRLAESTKIIAMQASVYADGLTRILQREQSANDDYKAAVNKATKSMSLELNVARSNIMDLALEGAEFKRIISVEQSKLASCSREVGELLTYQGLVSEKLVSQSNSLSITDSNNRVIDVSLQIPRVIDDRFDLYVAPVEKPVKTGFFF